MKEGIPVRMAWFGCAAAMVVLAAIMCAWSVRMAVADYWFRQKTPAGVRKAISLEPDGAGYYARLAALVEESNPGASTRALERAVALNPRDSQSLTELGLRAETAGDFAAAERDLLTAARVDKQYFPRWSLVNFYFRRGDLQRFWFWTRKAVEIGYGDLAPLFSLCWKVTSDGDLIERKLDIRTAEPEASYLTYLTGENRIEPIARAATRLLAWNRNADVPVLRAACDRLIAAGRREGALQIWNGLAQRHRTPDGVLQPEGGRSLTDGEFNVWPTSQGFDWRLPAVAGVTAFLAERPGGLRITFSGRQPENCEVLTQYLPVIENSSYELRYRFSTSGIASGSGLAWRITDLQGTGTLAQSESLASESHTAGRLTFRTPSGSQLARLALVYRRALGTTRVEGSITVQKVEVVWTRQSQP